MSLRLITAAALVILTALLAAPLSAQDEAPALPPQVVDPSTPIDELTLRLTPLTREELAAAAAAWLEIVKTKTTEVAEAQIAARRDDGDAETADRDRVASLVQERRALFAAFSAVVDAWEKKAGDPDAIAGFRAYRSAIIVEETRTADAQTMIDTVTTWALSREGGIALVIRTAIIVASFLGLLIVARLVRRLTRKAVGKVPNLSRLLQAFFVVVAYWVVLAVGLMVVLSALGIDVTPVFALIGGASFILAFALQSSLSNLAAGLMIMINRPFDEGDYVTVAGVGGTVKAVSVMSTTVTTPDNQVIVIPNSSVWGDVITNVTASELRRVDLVFGIGYGDDMKAAQAVIARLCAAHPLILDAPETVIRVGALGESSVDLLCRPWVKTADYWTVLWDLQEQVKAEFDAAGISIPFPQRDVHVHQAVAGAGPEAAPALAPAAPRRGGRGDFARDGEGADPSEDPS